MCLSDVRLDRYRKCRYCKHRALSETFIGGWEGFAALMCTNAVISFWFGIIHTETWWCTTQSLIFSNKCLEKSVESTGKFLNVRRSASNINKLLNETKLCHITTRLVCWSLKAYFSSRSHGTGEYPSTHWEERGCTLWIKPTSQDFSHIHTQAVLSSLLFTLWDKNQSSCTVCWQDRKRVFARLINRPSRGV